MLGVATDWDIRGVRSPRSIMVIVRARPAYHLPEVNDDLVASPLAHDTVDEYCSDRSSTGASGAASRSPAAPCRTWKIVERVPAAVPQVHLSSVRRAQERHGGGREVRRCGLLRRDRDRRANSFPCVEWEVKRYPSLEAEYAADLILISHRRQRVSPHTAVREW